MQKRRAFKNWIYWMKPVPGFGDYNARMWIIGLAPAGHGANRTGRMFTGDRSGEWLYRALYETGFSTAYKSYHAGDDLKLKDVFISAIVRCAPPLNKPARDEQENCAIYLLREAKLLKNLKLMLVLGRLAYDQIKRTFGWKKSPPFAHGTVFATEISAGGLKKSVTCVLSYHPSQQNTFTKKLTWNMWISVFRLARQLLSKMS